MASQSQTESNVGKPYIISTTSLKDSDFVVTDHDFDAASIRHTTSLGDPTGLTKLGVHLVRLPPHSHSSANHWHTQDDEWIYILEAGDKGATLVRVITHEEEGGRQKVTEETIKKGDFVAFPAMQAVGHHVQTGEEGIVYLVCGTRAPVDVCTYPLAGKKLVIDTTGHGEWHTEEGGVRWGIPPTGTRKV